MFILLLLLLCYLHQLNGDDQQLLPTGQQNCAQTIHKGCLNPYRPTEQEINNARIYIQTRFMHESQLKPTLPACPRLYVRQNFKCMTHEERLQVIRVLKQLYANGFMWELASIHAKCWIPWHKTVESLFAHRWITNKLEREMLRIDPTVTIPYWILAEDCSAPHESLIWDYFGRTGTNTSDYCVPDCPFRSETGNRCIRRQWLPDGTIAQWSCPEVEEHIINLNIPFYVILFGALSLHFKQHLNIGGWNGHYSDDWAPYDFVFHMHHTYYTDCYMARWQLTNSAHLTPVQDYNQLFRYDPDNRQQPLKSANLATDQLCHYRTPVRDTFHLGFGDQCFVCDQLVWAANQLWLQQTSANSSSDSNNYNNDNPFVTVGGVIGDRRRGLLTDPNLNCNPQCRRMPYPPDYRSHSTGRRHLLKMQTDGQLDASMATLWAENAVNFSIGLTNMNTSYCSPYVNNN